MTDFLEKCYLFIVIQIQMDSHACQVTTLCSELQKNCRNNLQELPWVKYRIEKRDG